MEAVGEDVYCWSWISIVITRHLGIWPAKKIEDVRC